ncbi:AraC family transcriptional regulator [Anaerosporobacter sp.]
MKEKFEEKRTRGSLLFPFEQYHMINTAGSLFVTYHWHKEIEIIYLHSGTLTLWIESKEYHLNSGDVYFINSEVLHQFSSTDKNTCYYAYVFPLESLQFALSDYSQTLVEPLLTHTMLFPNFVPKDSIVYENILKEVQELIHVNENKTLGYELTTKACILKLIGYLIQAKLLYTPTLLIHSSTAKKSDIRKQILSYIQENYASPISLEDLADLSHMSTKYFCHYFKQNFSMTFLEYVTRYRIEKARIFLKDTGLSVMEIGFLVGYENFSYFIRTFKRIVGITPAKYRMEVQKEDSE